MSWCTSDEIADDSATAAGDSTAAADEDDGIEGFGDGVEVVGWSGGGSQDGRAPVSSSVLAGPNVASI